MENKKYYIAIDKESKRYKVFEDREQGFRLTTIKHCKHLYVSLLDVKFSLKLNTSKFSMLKKNLAEAFKNKRLIYDIKVMKGDKNETIPFVREIHLYRFLGNKNYLRNNSKRDAFEEWYNKVLFDPIHEKYDFQQLLMDTFIPKTTQSEIKSKWLDKHLDKYAQIRRKRTDMGADDEMIVPNRSALYGKAIVDIDGRDLELIFDENTQKVYCYSDDLARVCRRPVDQVSWDIHRILKNFDKLNQQSEKENFTPTEELDDYSYSMRANICPIYRLTKRAVTLISLFSKSTNEKSISRYSLIVKEIEMLENELNEKAQEKAQNQPLNEDRDEFSEFNAEASQNDELNAPYTQNPTQSGELDGEFGVILFENTNLGKVRVKGNGEEPLFCLADICKILGLTTSAKIADMVKTEFELYELNSHSFDSGYGIKEFTMLTEPQLYFVLMRSDKPKARPFRQWVVNEVLPSIRKKGRYEHKGFKPEVESSQSQNSTTNALLAELLKQNNMLLAHILNRGGL